MATRPRQRRAAPTDPRRSRGQSAPRKRPVQKKPGKPRKKQSTREATYTPNVWYRILSLLVVVIVFVLGITIFFRVDEIQVAGNGKYTVEQIQEASGISIGDNLIGVSDGDVAGRIFALLPYVENVQVGKKLPNVVTIQVTESDASFEVQADDGATWLINASGKLLAESTVTAGNYPTIVGITAVEPVAGEQLVALEEESLNAALLVIGQLETTDYISKIVEINVEKPYEIIMYYGEIYEIQLGGSDEMGYKIQYLTAVLEQLREDEAGIIDLTFGEEKVARYRPW